MSKPPTRANKKHAKGECLTPSRKQGQIDRTKTWIEDALIWFAEQGRFADVTISELCEKAGVGRPTFYRHFNAKEDVIRSRTTKIFNQFLLSIEEFGLDTVSVEQVNIATLEHWQRNSDFFRLARFTDIKRIIFSETDCEMELLTQLTTVYATMDPFLRAFRYWGMKGILLEWVNQDMRQTPHEIHAALTTLNNKRT